MKKRKTKLTKNMLVEEVIHKFPGSAQIMQEAGMHCVGCHVSSFETLEEGATVHGINVNQLINKINNLRG